MSYTWDCLPTANTSVNFEQDFRDTLNSWCYNVKHMGCRIDIDPYLEYVWANVIEQNAQTGMIDDQLGLRDDEGIVYKYSSISGIGWEYYYTIVKSTFNFDVEFCCNVFVRGDFCPDGNIYAGNINSTGNLYGTSVNITHDLFARDICSNRNIYGVDVFPSGNVYGANLCPSGNVYGVDLCPSGGIYGTNATFSGNVTANNLYVGGQVYVDVTLSSVCLEAPIVCGTTCVYAAKTISPQLFLNYNVNPSSGISWKANNSKAWTTYIGTAGQVNAGPTENITVPTGAIVTGYGHHNFIENTDGYGWVWEAGTCLGDPAITMELRACDGLLRVPYIYGVSLICSPILCGTTCLRGGFVYSTGNICAGGTVGANILSGIVCLCSTVVCGSTCIESPIFCGPTFSAGTLVCTPIVCGTTCVAAPTVCGTTSVLSPTVHATTLVCSPTVCGTTSVLSPTVCGTTSVLSPTVHATTLVCSPTVCATTAMASPSFTGVLTGNATTATCLQTARTLTIGDTGQTFNGSANVSWTRAQMGVPYSKGSTATPLENTESVIAYVSNALLGAPDGALYSHVYSASWKHQIQGDYRTGQIALRGKNSGAWQAWRTVLDSGNYTSYVQPTANPTFTGTLTVPTINATTSVTSPFFYIGNTTSYICKNVSHLYMRNTTASGNLYLQTANASGTNQASIYMYGGSCVVLYNAGLQKLSTTTTGINVTGCILTSVTCATNCMYSPYICTSCLCAISHVHSPSFVGALTGNASTASSVAWANVAAGGRQNFGLCFQPSGASYAGFCFLQSSGAHGGYFLFRGSGDNLPTYSAEGITLVAESGHLNLVTRTLSTNRIRFVTGSTGASLAERMTILGDGNVGIGTDSPDRLLDVESSAPILRIMDSTLGGQGDGTSDYGDLFGRIEFGNADNSHQVNGYQAWIQAAHLRAGTGHTSADAGLQFGVTGLPNLSSGFVAMVIDNSGKVGIGKTNPAQALDVVGNITASGTVTAPTFAGTATYATGAGRLYDTNYRRFTNPGGGESVGNPPSTTGAIEIVIPHLMSAGNQMMRMTVQIYEYTTNESFTVYIAGYNYSPGTWHRPTAYILGNPGTSRQFTVRFGRNAAGNAVVYIGEIASTWSYPQVFLTEVQVGYSGYLDFSTGWAINFRTAAFENVTRTITAPQIGYTVSPTFTGTLTVPTINTTHLKAWGMTPIGSIVAIHHSITIAKAISSAYWTACDATGGNVTVTYHDGTTGVIARPNLSDDRFLMGGTAAGTGGSNTALIAHTHTGPSHTHTGTSNSRTPGATGLSGTGNTGSTTPVATGVSGTEKTGITSAGTGSTTPGATGSTTPAATGGVSANHTHSIYGNEDAHWTPAARMQTSRGSGINHNLASATNSAGHTHGSAAHTHGSAAHSHTGSAHDHTGSSHSHASAAHTHTGPSHSHTSAAHTHAFTTGSAGTGASGSTGSGTSSLPKYFKVKYYMRIK